MGLLLNNHNWNNTVTAFLLMRVLKANFGIKTFLIPSHTKKKTLLENIVLETLIQFVQLNTIAAIRLIAEEEKWFIDAVWEKQITNGDCL